MRARVAALVASLAAGLASWPVSVVAVSPQLRSTPAVPLQSPVSLPRPSAGLPRPGDGAAAPAAAWDTFSADVTIRRSLIRKDGSAGPVAPEVKYRWVRALGDDGWKTTLTLVSVAPAVLRTPAGPKSVPVKVPVSRIEIGDPRTPARAFDAEGRLVFMLPTPPKPADDPDSGTEAGAIDAPDPLRTAARRSTLDLPSIAPDVFDRAASMTRSREWIDQLVPSAAGRASRQAGFARHMGAPRGSVRGLQRFVSNDGDTTTEVLSDPSWAVPHEVNVVRNGVLTSHSTFSYAEDPGAGLVRRRIKTEQLVSAESGDRAVVDVEFANIRLDRSGAR